MSPRGRGFGVYQALSTRNGGEVIAPAHINTNRIDHNHLRDLTRVASEFMDRAGIGVMGAVGGDNGKLPGTAAGAHSSGPIASSQ